jgi:TPR repeat protein
MPPGEPPSPKLVIVVPSGQKAVAQISPDRGDKGANSPKSSAEETARAEQLLARGDAYLADGNVMGARDFYERAADIGLATAAIRMAETYDPRALQRLQALGVVPDPNQARKWYERARALGAPEATEPLSRLTAK